MIYNRGMQSHHKVALTFIFTAVLPFAAHAELRISEIMYDPDGSDSKKEWVEVYNEGPYMVDLSTVKFVDKSVHVLNRPPKNGGVGTITIVPNSYVVLAADAATFHTLFAHVPQVIDTAMSLNNTGATIGLNGNNGPLVRAVYDSSLGADGTGESLQWNGDTWVHAEPTPGRENAAVSTIPVTVVSHGTSVQKKASETVSVKKETGPVASKSRASFNEADNPVSVVNATASDVFISETAAAGSLDGSSWWFAAAALALSTGAAVTMISRTKRNEWNIEES